MLKNNLVFPGSDKPLLDKVLDDEIGIFLWRIIDGIQRDFRMIGGLIWIVYTRKPIKSSSTSPCIHALYVPSFTYIQGCIDKHFHKLIIPHHIPDIKLIIPHHIPDIVTGNSIGANY